MCGRKRSGFTLIELLVVTSIVVLLMALMLPGLSRARKQARGVQPGDWPHWMRPFKEY